MTSRFLQGYEAAENFSVGTTMLRVRLPAGLESTDSTTPRCLKSFDRVLAHRQQEVGQELLGLSHFTLLAGQHQEVGWD